MRYFLRGLSPEEIAASVQTHESTIYRDLEEIRVIIKEKVEAAELWPVKKHFLLLEELIRESFSIYHRPKEQRRDGMVVDDNFRKLAALGLLLKIINSAGKLAFGEKIEFKQRPTETSQKLREAIRGLTQRDRLTLARIMDRIQNPKTSSGA